MFQSPRLRTFFKDESGAVTVDWVVITATLCGMTLAMMLLFRDALSPQSENLGSELQQFTISTTFD
ncbi:MAG: hypothetical protein AAGB05_16180 [Pseudomonadota bacterium]